MITRDKIRAFREKLQAVIKDADLGDYALKVGSISFSESNFTVKLEGAEVGESGVVKDREYETLKQLGPIYGLGDDAFGKQIRLQGSTYTIKGLNMRRPKFPVSAVNQNGKRYKLMLEDVQRALGTK